MIGSAPVYDQLRDDILSCKLAPGLAVYEQELAQRFGVSKSPVREALLRLQEQNLVEVRARSGYRVRPLSLIEASEMYEMRLLYEIACITRAITHAGDEQIAALEDHLTKEPHLAAPDWIALNRRFHSALASICGNARMADAAIKLNDQFDRFTYVSVGRLQQPLDFTRFNEEHAGIIDALRSRDKRRAVSIVRAHIEASRQRTLQALANPAIIP
jgi:DNA-binding GntR family transcriptional regulator